MRRTLTVLSLSLLATAGGLAVPAQAAAPSAAGTPVVRAVKYKNCTALNKAYKHGVGRKGAKDKTRSGKNPVRTFYVSTALYNTQPRALDRDRDGIACEKR